MPSAPGHRFSQTRSKNCRWKCRWRRLPSRHRYLKMQQPPSPPPLSSPCNLDGVNSLPATGPPSLPPLLPAAQNEMWRLKGRERGVRMQWCQHWERDRRRRKSQGRPTNRAPPTKNYGFAYVSVDWEFLKSQSPQKSATIVKKSATRTSCTFLAENCNCTFLPEKCNSCTFLWVTET